MLKDSDFVGDTVTISKERYMKDVNEVIDRRKGELKSSIDLLRGAWWAGTDYKVFDENNMELEDFANKLLDAYTEYLIRGLMEDLGDFVKGEKDVD